MAGKLRPNLSSTKIDLSSKGNSNAVLSTMWINVTTKTPLFDCPAFQDRHQRILDDKTFERLSMVENMQLRILADFSQGSVLFKPTTNRLCITLSNTIEAHIMIKTNENLSVPIVIKTCKKGRHICIPTKALLISAKHPSIHPSLNFINYLQLKSESIICPVDRRL